jgi:hypothetical protein
MLPIFGGGGTEKLSHIGQAIASNAPYFEDPNTQYVSKIVTGVRDTSSIIKGFMEDQDENFQKLFDLLERSIDRGDNIVKLETKVLDELATMIARAQVDKEKTKDPTKIEKYEKYIERLTDLSNLTREHQAQPDMREKAWKRDIFGAGYKKDLQKRIDRATSEGKAFGSFQKLGFYSKKFLGQPIRILTNEIRGRHHEDEDAPETFDTKVKQATSSARLLDYLKSAREHNSDPTTVAQRAARGSRKYNASVPTNAPTRAEKLLEAILKEINTFRRFFDKESGPSEADKSIQKKEAQRKRLSEQASKQNRVGGKFVKGFKSEGTPAVVGSVDKSLDDEHNLTQNTVDNTGDTLSAAQKQVDALELESQTIDHGAGNNGGILGGSGSILGTVLGGAALKKFFTKGAAKVATKEAAEAAGKKVVGKAAAKALGKSALKKIPLIGLAAGLGFGASRLMKGDLKGAALEVASGGASMIPGAGTAASLAIDEGIAARDIKNASIEASPQPTGEAIELMANRVEQADAAANKSTPVVNVNQVTAASPPAPDLTDIVGATRSPDNSFMRFQDKRQARVL